jgi:hypothetical protein
MKLLFDFRPFPSGNYPCWHGIEEDTLRAIDYAIIESVTIAVRNYAVPWFRRLAVNAHF